MSAKARVRAASRRAIIARRGQHLEIRIRIRASSHASDLSILCLRRCSCRLWRLKLPLDRCGPKRVPVSSHPNLISPPSPSHQSSETRSPRPPLPTIRLRLLAPFFITVRITACQDDRVCPPCRGAGARPRECPRPRCQRTGGTVVKDCDSGDRPGAVDGHERHGST